MVEKTGPNISPNPPGMTYHVVVPKYKILFYRSKDRFTEYRATKFKFLKNGWIKIKATSSKILYLRGKIVIEEF